MKKVVYTIILDNYDELKQIDRKDDWDYFAFISPYDKNKYNDTNWTILPIPEDILNFDIIKHKKQRFIKMHPHLLFPNYTLSLYIDGTIKIKGDLNEFLLRLLTPNFNIYMIEHPYRNCIYKEITEVVKLFKEKKKNTDFLEYKYLKENFPKDYGLIESNIIVRKHNEKECIELMEEWWKIIIYYSHRDQLSLNYLLWKKRLKIKYFSIHFRRFYFKQTLSHLIVENYK